MPGIAFRTPRHITDYHIIGLYSVLGEVISLALLGGRKKARYVKSINFGTD
jgi:hypothetical protein